MIDIASINRTFPATFAKIMPSRTPVASFCKTFECYQHNRLLNAHCRCVLGMPPTHCVHTAATIFAPTASANGQIAIAPRRC
jgi:hypothetical protein